MNELSTKVKKLNFFALKFYKSYCWAGMSNLQSNLANIGWAYLPNKSLISAVFTNCINGFDLDIRNQF